MPSRPSWKGYLKLSLVACPVAMFNATTTRDKVAFHLLARDTHDRLRRQMVDPESGAVVASEDQVRGYEVGKGDYVVVEDDEFDAIAIESTHTIDVDHFVPRDKIDDLYLDNPNYLVPDGKMGEEAFAVIRDAMTRKGMAGLARVVMARRERVLLLQPRGRGILATTLRYPYEIVPETPLLAGIKDVAVGAEMLDLAGHIIDTKTGPFDPAAFKDRYEEAMLALLKAKKAGKPAKPVKTPARPDNVVDLMDALRASVGQAPAKGRAKAHRATAKPASPAARAPRRKAG